MERPVRSFESFLRTAPPHQTQPPPDNKPLPAIPSPRLAQKTAAPSIQSKSLHRKPSWKAPPDWDEPSSPKQDPQTSSFSAPRNYRLIIPEPSPGIGDDHDSIVWQFNSSPTQHSYLTPIDEQSHDRPSSPHRSSYSAFAHTAVPENDYCLLDLPANPNIRIPSPDSAVTHPVATSSRNTETFSNTPLPDVMLRSSNSMMKQKAFSQLGSENPAEEQAGLPPSAIPPRSFGAGNGNEAVLSMRGKKLQSLSQGGLKLEEESESGDSSERSQQLPVSLDYHNALADQYHEAYLHDSSAQTESTEKNTMTSYFFMRSSKVPSKSAELMPRPLSWKKDPNGSSPGSSQSNIHTDVTPNSQGVSRRHRKVAAWVPFHQRTHSQHCSSLEEEQAGSASDSASATRREISGVEKLRLLNKEIILSKLVPQVKRLRSNITGDDLAGKNVATALPAGSFPMEQPRPLFRLPGGLVIVRQPPTPTPKSRDNSFSGPSTALNIPQNDSYADLSGFDIVPSPRRPSSLYSQQSESPVAPARSVHGRLRSPITFPPSPQSRSSTSSPPTSSLAHEIEIPRTPPPIPSQHEPRTPPTLSSWSQRDEGRMDDDRADSANEDEPRRRKLHTGILNKARDARDSWKRHQRHAKHMKLKQSIRVLGPTDPGVSEAYMRREDRVPGHGDARAGRLPGYMDGGLI
ncbi:hypothetical protein HBH98_052700 [Parastagonospora nodorum]|nr:hypothetical protein HBH53_103430 [Parastagonospora nodorum]KAH3968870.1 hypothetical protein HBH51_127330 [Parastagonospora nodorum]KAH3989672.1 hypothetical protein HBH52_014590 [Parastagonospora nodorum]KAH3997203.1 hypothetical protein HBI10_148160 [Parastagonospora nodorum]KAH4020033.1 hypothetical protein HBI13_121310 [Parastagonospora nodorum]